jgi:hypothetical protein
MNLTWLGDTGKKCRDAHVALFVKQDSSHRAGQQGRIPNELWVRQFPKIFRESHQKRFGLVYAR